MADDNLVPFDDNLEPLDAGLTPISREPKASMSSYEPPSFYDKARDYITNPQTIENTLQMGGAVAGGAIGKSPQGILAGSTLGAMAGRNIAGMINQEMPQETLKKTLGAGYDELVWGGGAMALGPLMGVIGRQQIVGRIFGVTNPESMKAAEIARDMNVPLGVIDVTKRSTVEGIPEVLGVFPFAGGGLRKAKDIKETALIDAKDTLLDQVAPNVTLSKLGVDVYSAAKQTSKAERAVGGGLYKKIEDFNISLGNPKAYPTASIKDAISSHFTKEDRIVTGLSRDESGRFTRTETTIERPIHNAGLEKYLENLNNLPPNISYSNLRVIEKDLNSFLYERNLNKSDKNLIISVKQGLEMSTSKFNESALDPAQAKELRDLTDTANTYWAALMKNYSSPVGKTIKRIDKNVFESGPFKAGSLTSSKLGDILVKYKDTESLNQLRMLIGPKEFNKVSRSVLNQASQKSTFADPVHKDKTIFDWNTFSKRLGLETPEGRETLSILLKDSGVSPTSFEKIVNLGKIHSSVDISSAATFIKRRMVLSGVKGAGAVAGVGASIAEPTSLLFSIPALLMVRFPITWTLSSPKALNWMTTAMDTSAPNTMRWMAAGSLASLYNELDAKENLMNMYNPDNTGEEQ